MRAIRTERVFEIDDVVGIDNAAQIFMTAKHPKSFISLDRADHLLSNKEDSTYVGAMVATWASKYIEDGRNLCHETKFTFVHS